MSTPTVQPSAGDYRDFFDAMIDTVWVIGPDAEVVEVNRKAVELLGYSVCELQRIGLPGIDRALSASAIREMVRRMPQDTTQVFETVHCAKDGRLIPVEVNSSLVNYCGRQAILSVARDISERKRAEAELRKRIEEQSLLLRETHHRMKNNIASVGALLSMHADAVSSPEAVSALRDAAGRVGGIHRLYDKMLLSNAPHLLESDTYLDGLVESILAVYDMAGSIELHRHFEPVVMDSQKLFSLGIVVNELVTNACKYAFTGRPEYTRPRLSVHTAVQDRLLTLTVEDNGRGMPPGFCLDAAESFGLTLVRIMAEQLGGVFRVAAGRGTRCVVSFPLQGI